jgi:energy-coupling factor transport system ATP-binding protein
MENVELDRQGVFRVKSPIPAISIRGLSFSFLGKTEPALKNIEIDIPEGEFVVVTGQSGCGKSTLAMAMGGYIPHVIEGKMSGDAWVKGENTKDVDLSDIAVKVSLCQQDPESQLCTLSVFDEVSFGPENLVLPVDEAIRRVERSLSAVGSSYLKDKGIFELSGGEKQRVAIASMLAMDTDVLILDEPTSCLDPDSAYDVLKTIERLRLGGNITIIVIEHKLDRLVGLADRLIVMDTGKIVLDGTPGEVYPKYKEMLNVRNDRPYLPGKDSSRSADNGRIESICVNDLRFSYGTEEVLHGITFRASRGELIGIIGPNGSGKSTFLACLTGLNRPSSGSVVIGGLDARKARTSEIARKVGFVFQNPNHQIFESKVFDEVAFACRNFGFSEDAAGESARHVMDKYGIMPYADNPPFRLSYGEKRRLNLCSVLPHDPDIIILDEPFVGQDLYNTGKMLKDIMSLKDAGKTIMMVSHDMDVVFRYCDRIVLFDSGRILVDGSPDEAVEKIRAVGKMNFLPGGPSHAN